MNFKEFWGKRKQDILLGALVLYVISLGVVTLDELFHLGIFPTALEKQINVQIKKIKDPDPKIQAEGLNGIMEIGDFAVPQLMKLLDTNDVTVRKNAITLLSKLTGQSFGDDAKAWEQWYRKHRDEY